MTRDRADGLRPRAQSLRCYAEGRDGDWQAICLDLDIAVQGSTFQEVLDSLRAAIFLYVESVTDLAPQERQPLLPRPAPLSVRLKFLAMALRGLVAGNGGDKQRHQFTLPLTACD
jgi:predicted RNase H-like HicB family nuclease